MRPLALLTLAACVACGGRTELLREQPQARSDAGTSDAGQLADAGSRRDTGIGCDEVVALEPVSVSLPREPIFFRPLVDGDYIYHHDRNGSQDEILRRPVGQPGQIDLTILNATSLVDVRHGLILFNGRDAADGQTKAGLFRVEDQRRSFFSTPALLPDSFGFVADAQFVSETKTAWLDQANTYVLHDAENDTAVEIAGGVTALAVGSPLTAWSRAQDSVFIEDIERGGQSYSLPFRGTVDRLAVGADEVAGLVDGSPFIWQRDQPAATRPTDVPTNNCLFVVASAWGAVFVCTEDGGRTTFAHAVSGERTTVVPTGRSVVVSVSMFDEFLSYVAFPAGEDFCQGGTEGRVKLYDLNENQTYDLGKVTSPCGCCGRISPFPRTHVRDNVVLWHGETNAEGSFGFEYGAARIERRCE